MTIPANEIDSRLRQLERDQVAMTVQHQAIKDQQVASWDELRSITKEMRDEFKALRADITKNQEATMTAINSNRIAWSMMNSGTKVAAWIILALFSLAGIVTGAIQAFKKLG